MVAVPAPVQIPGVTAQRIAFIRAYILDQVVFLKDRVFIKEKAGLGFIQKGLGDQDLVKETPGILVGQRTGALFVERRPGVVKLPHFYCFCPFRAL